VMGRTEIDFLERERAQKKLIYATIFCLAFLILEAIGGWIAGSLAIITDAAHLLTDVSSFFVSIIANILASRPASDTLTFGLIRAEVLGALLSTVTIWVLTFWLVYEAIQRMIDWFDNKSHPVNGELMSIIAIIGLGVNIGLILILGHGHGHGHGHDHSHGAKQNHSASFHAYVDENSNTYIISPLINPPDAEMGRKFTNSLTQTGNDGSKKKLKKKKSKKK